MFQKKFNLCNKSNLMPGNCQPHMWLHGNVFPHSWLLRDRSWEHINKSFGKLCKMAGSDANEGREERKCQHVSPAFGVCVCVCWQLTSNLQGAHCEERLRIEIVHLREQLDTRAEENGLWIMWLYWQVFKSDGLTLKLCLFSLPLSLAAPTCICCLKKF